MLGRSSLKKNSNFCPSSFTPCCSRLDYKCDGWSSNHFRPVGKIQIKSKSLVLILLTHLMSKKDLLRYFYYIKKLKQKYLGTELIFGVWLQMALLTTSRYRGISRI